jgi:hypothetical protein
MNSTPDTGHALPRSTVESRAAALLMFAGNIPCILQFADPPCPKQARWIAWFTHEENNTECGYDEPQLVCDDHKRVIQKISHPFWRTWLNLDPIQCDDCGSPLRLDRLEPIA